MLSTRYKYHNQGRTTSPIVNNINCCLKENGTLDKLAVTVVKWNYQGNYIIIIHLDLIVTDILYTEDITNIITPGATDIIRKDKKLTKN